jgi:hypothetical protein
VDSGILGRREEVKGRKGEWEKQEKVKGRKGEEVKRRRGEWGKKGIETLSHK